MKIEYKEGLIVLKDQEEEVGYIKYVKKEENPELQAETGNKRK